MKKFLPLSLAALCLMASCSGPFTDGYVPEYMKEDSPLDPPGTADARKALREKYAKLAKDSVFKPGDSIEVKEGRVYLLARNPDNVTNPVGMMVKSEKAEIISCEGLYYFVKMDDGKRGYLRESDLVSPVQLVPTDPLLIGNGDLFPGALPTDGTPGPLEDVPLDENQKLTTNADGRTVVIVDKKTDRSAEFEAQKKAMESAADAAAGKADSNQANDNDDAPPLPDSTVGN